MPIIIETDINGKQTIVTDKSEIKNKQKTYYEKLYKKQEINKDVKIDDFLPDRHEGRKITDNTKDKLE